MEQRHNALLLFSILLCLFLWKVEGQSRGVLVLKQGWSPLFCYSGSVNSVPREFCGLEKKSAKKRYLAHRILRLDVSGEKDCKDTTGGYKKSKLGRSLKRMLECTSNSYTKGNTNAWLDEYVWRSSGTCVAQNSPSITSVKGYFEAMTDLFEKYNVDSALKERGILFSKIDKVNGTEILNVLEDAFGARGYYTCDRATASKWNIFNLCLSTKAPYKPTKCPESEVEKMARCSEMMEVDKNRGYKVDKKCKKYYPSGFDKL
eukprot:jgi/Picsp_1/2366/NSC_05829-R1_ribonuclease t2